MLTQARLHELFDYEPETGNLIRKIARSARACIGDVAGTLRPDGYRHIGIAGKLYQAHQLVWFWHHGEWPRKDLDHINRVRDDNRIENLRDVPRSVNIANQDRPSETGLKGVRKLASDRWMARIGVNGKTKYIGSFKSPQDAHAAFKEAHVAIYGVNSQYYKEAA